MAMRLALYSARGPCCVVEPTRKHIFFYSSWRRQGMERGKVRREPFVVAQPSDACVSPAGFHNVWPPVLLATATANFRSWARPSILQLTPLITPIIILSNQAHQLSGTRIMLAHCKLRAHGQKHGAERSTCLSRE
jgi:hypothetical protein